MAAQPIPLIEPDIEADLIECSRCASTNTTLEEVVMPPDGARLSRNGAAWIPTYVVCANCGYEELL